MNDMNWADIVASITPLEPTDLDGIIDTLRPPLSDSKQTVFPVETVKNPIPVQFRDETTVCFGARVTKDTPDRLGLAMTLAQMAAEKGAFPIILSHLDYSGLEQFGFRVERVAGKNAEEIEACEAQICEFWKIVMVI